MPEPVVTEQACQLQTRVQHVFADQALFARALTHRSVGPTHNERLEFLGDAVIELIVTSWLFELFPNYSEGELTRLRAKIVRRESLARYARQIKLGEALKLGSGELKSGGRHRDSILADGFEALVGAIYLDSGFTNSRKILIPLIEPSLEKLLEAASTKDAKTQLQEWLQSRGQALPEYQVIKTQGVDHEQIFTVQCTYNSMNEVAIGEGSSRRRAEQNCAQHALIALGLRSADV